MNIFGVYCKKRISDIIIIIMKQLIILEYNEGIRKNNRHMGNRICPDDGLIDISCDFKGGNKNVSELPATALYGEIVDLLIKGQKIRFQYSHLQ